MQFSDHTLENLTYKKTENYVSSNIRHQEHKRNALINAQNNIQKLQNEISDCEIGLEKAVLELTLMTDGPQSLKIKLKDFTNKDLTDEQRTRVDTYMSK